MEEVFWKCVQSFNFMEVLAVGLMFFWFYGRVERRFDQVDQRFDRMEDRLDDIDRRVCRIEGGLSNKTYCALTNYDTPRKKRHG